MKNNFFYLLLFSVLLSACSKDDSPFVDAENTVDLEAVFYNKTWSIYEVEGNGTRADVPEEGACGRNYFRYLQNGEYIEYLYQSSSCIPQINRLNFSLSGSKIILSDDNGGGAEVRILKLDETNFNFETTLDVDNDGNDDEVKFYCRKYTPQDRDIYSDTFETDFFKFQDDRLIAFTWSEYVGDDFKQYEIYRSSSSCNKTDAILIATITDLSLNEFVDLNPEPVEELCYFFRLQTNTGQLAESDMISINTRDIRPFKVEMLQPQVLDNTIVLNWQKSEKPYFQNYEITVSMRAHYDNSPEEIVIATIDNQDITSYTIESPPMVQNPVFNIHVYNVFGFRSTLNLGDSFTDPSAEVIYTPKEIVGMHSVRAMARDNQEPNVLYLWGYGQENSNLRIKKYDIDRQQIVAESSLDSNFGSIGVESFKIVNNPVGKEIIVESGGVYEVFDAQSLEYKYRLRDLNDEYIDFEDFLYFKDDIWIIANDGKELRTVRRFGRDLQTIDILNPEPTRTFNNMNRLVRTGDNKILAGVVNEERSFLFEINDNGSIAGFEEVDFSFNNNNKYSIEYNANSNVLIDKRNSRIFSVDDYNFISSYGSPVHTSSLSLDGNHVLGTNYNGDDSVIFREVFTRQLDIWNWKTGEQTVINTRGYPQYVYEHANGKLVVLSSFFKRDRFDRGGIKNDLFVEIFDWK